jgi:hypothetical protein
MRFLRDTGIAVIGAAAVGLIAAYIANPLLGLWAGLAAGMALLITATTLDRRKGKDSHEGSVQKCLAGRGQPDRVALLREQYDKGFALRPNLIWPPGGFPTTRTRT